MTTADWDGDECFMCNGTGRDRWPVTERRGIFEHVVGHVENGRPCRACNGHGRQPSVRAQRRPPAPRHRCGGTR